MLNFNTFGPKWWSCDWSPQIKSKPKSATVLAYIVVRKCENNCMEKISFQSFHQKMFTDPALSNKAQRDVWEDQGGMISTLTNMSCSMLVWVYVLQLATWEFWYCTSLYDRWLAFTMKHFQLCHSLSKLIKTHKSILSYVFLQQKLTETCDFWS